MIDKLINCICLSTQDWRNHDIEEVLSNIHIQNLTDHFYRAIVFFFDKYAFILRKT